MIGYYFDCFRLLVIWVGGFVSWCFGDVYGFTMVVGWVVLGLLSVWLGFNSRLCCFAFAGCFSC